MYLSFGLLSQRNVLKFTKAISPTNEIMHMMKYSMEYLVVFVRSEKEHASQHERMIKFTVLGLCVF